MRRLRAVLALVVGLALFAAPAAWACGELGRSMDCCPELRAHESPHGSGCQTAGQSMAECCATSPDPQPIEARVAGEPCGPTAATPAERGQVAPVEDPDSHGSRVATGLSGFRQPDRYLLNASFLL